MKVKIIPDKKRKLGYTSISNHIFRNPDLSLKAKGLFALIMSVNPKTWNHSINGYAKCNKDGADAIKSALKELEKHGFLEIDRSPVKGKFNAIYFYHECPIQSGSTTTEKSTRKKPRQTKPTRGNPVQSNTNKTNTKRLTTKGESKSKNNQSIGQDGEIDFSSSKNAPSKGGKLKLSDPKEARQKRERKALIAEVHEQVNYDSLILTIGRKCMYDDIVEVIVDVLSSNEKNIKVGKQDISAVSVKASFRKLDSTLIERAVRDIKASGKKIKNLKSYLITVLYNIVENPHDVSPGEHWNQSPPPSLVRERPREWKKGQKSKRKPGIY